MSGSTVININKTIATLEEMVLLSEPVHALSDSNLLDVCNFSSKIPWKKQLCYSCAPNLHPSDGFHSTAGISTSSADAVLLVLTREMARFRSMKELQRRANRSVLSIDMVFSLCEKMIREI